MVRRRGYRRVGRKRYVGGRRLALKGATPVLTRYRKAAVRTKRGFLSIMRKLPLITVSNSGVVGNYSLTDPTTTCLSLGTPSLSPGFGANVYDIPFSLQFRLDQVVQSGDITALADQYKLIGAYVRIFYNVNLGIGQNATVAAGMPFIQYITDHDDAAIPNPVNIRSRMGLKFKTFKANSGYVGMMVRPVPSMSAYVPTGTAYAVPNRAPWLNTTDADVPHYAIKGILCQVPLPDGPIADSGQSVFTIDVAQRILAKDFQ